MTFAIYVQAAIPKFSLQNYPEQDIQGLVESIEIEQLQLAVNTDALKSSKLEVSLKGKLGFLQGVESLLGKFTAKLKGISSQEKTFQMILFSRNLMGPCDYNGFQKVTLSFKLNEQGEILPSELDSKLIIYQRDLSCANNFQTFTSDYL